ncbi:hypothetical protein TNCV_3768741 [Trichonephila clavipes]|nr:hypothetical protein TNCV_3768741 [Trichonephila clavipes]
MKAVSVLEHFSDHGSIQQKMKKNTTSVRSYPNSAGDATELVGIQCMSYDYGIDGFKKVVLNAMKDLNGLLPLTSKMTLQDCTAASRTLSQEIDFFAA